MMRVLRKPAAAAMVAVAALLMMSSFGIAGTTWGGRTYSTVGFSFPGANGTLLLSAPAPSGGLAGTTVLSASGSGGRAGFSRAASGSVLLCPDPCVGTRLGVDGSVSGLGSTGEAINMDVQSDVIITCTNQGGNPSPGRNFVALLSGSTPYNAQDVTKNGRFYFSSDNLFVDGSGSDFAIGDNTADGTLPNGATYYGCSNDNWTATVTRYQFLCSKLTAVSLTKDGKEVYSSVLDAFSARCTLAL